MDFINYSNFSDSFLKKAIKFCRPVGIDINTIVFKNSKTCYYGYCYPDKLKIVIGIGPHTFYPLAVRRTKKFINLGYASGFRLNSKKEALFYLLAHELKHLEQQMNKYFKREGSNRTKFSESDADLYALKILEKWRARR